MKKTVFTLLIGFTITISCNQKGNESNQLQDNSNQTLKTAIDSSKIYKQEAIKLS